MKKTLFRSSKMGLCVAACTLCAALLSPWLGPPLFRQAAAVGKRNIPFKESKRRSLTHSHIQDLSSVAHGSLVWQKIRSARCYSEITRGPDGTLYLGCRNNRIYAVSRRGKTLWSVSAGRDVDSTPTLGADGTVYVGSDDGYLYAVSSKGKLRWKYRIGSVVYASPAVTLDGRVFVGSRDDHFYAISRTGHLLWKTRLDGDVDGSPVVGPNGTIYVGTDKGRLYAILPNGTIKWKASFPGDLRYKGVLTPRGNLAIVTLKKRLRVYEPVKGKLLWKQKLSSRYNTPPLLTREGRLLVHGSAEGIQVYSTSGLLMKSLRIGSTGRGYLSKGIGGSIILAKKKGSVYVLDSNLRLRWRAEVPGDITGPAVMDGDGALLVAGRRGLFRLSPPL